MTTVIGCTLGLGVIFEIAWLADRYILPGDGENAEFLDPE